MEAILPHEREAGLPGRVNLLQEEEPEGSTQERSNGTRAGEEKGKREVGDGKVSKGRGWFKGWFTKA